MTMARKKKELLWRKDEIDIAERGWPDKPSWMYEGEDMPPADYAYTQHGDPKTGKTTWAAPARSAWTTGDVPQDMEAKECSWSCKNKAEDPVIMLSEKVTTSIMWLMENKNVEWQMLLSGKVYDFPGEGEVLSIDDFYIPKQRVSGATVHNEDCIDKQFIEERKIICTIHSHVSMGAFFSSTDMTECNTSPIKYHIVMNNKYEYQSVKQVKLPCGMLKFVKCDVVLYSPKSVQPEGIENITGGYRNGPSTLA
jgi:proteasome lid subunit RPN8/RPN11